MLERFDSNRYSGLVRRWFDNPKNTLLCAKVHPMQKVGILFYSIILELIFK